MTAYELYLKILYSIPTPGGNGCHPYLLKVANKGVRAGLSDQQMLCDIRRHIPDGTRTVDDQEILDAICKARNSKGQSHMLNAGAAASYKPVAKPIFRPEDVNAFIQLGAGASEEAITSASPLRIVHDPSWVQTLALLMTLYDNSDILFLGNRKDWVVHTVREWKKKITSSKGLVPWPQIIPNPVTGNRHLRRDQKGRSYRCDNAIKDFRIAVAEFDNLSKPEQFCFWAGIPLPIHALIDSGGKSIHAWIKIRGVSSNEDWDSVVRTELYKRRLIPLGVDSACQNESRLSRLPGHYRAEKGRRQRLLYLDPDPDGTPIIDRMISGDKKS